MIRSIAFNTYFYVGTLLVAIVGVVLVPATCFTPIITALTAIGVRGVEPSIEEADDFLSNFEGLMQQPLVLH